MYRLFSIEYFKLKNTKYFWALIVLFSIFLLAVPIGAKVFMDYMASIGEELTSLGLGAGEMPLFDFIDIWQNLTWVYKACSILLGFIAVISFSNEYSYGTIKQNVIDGLSRKEFLLSKIVFIVLLSGIVSLVALGIGLIMGLMWSPVKSFPFIIENIEFIPAYFIHLVVFQLFCLFISMLIKRSGITIAILMFYIFVIEPIAYMILRFEYKLEWLADLLPATAIGNIIRLPFAKYALQETQTYVSFADLGVLLVYMTLILLLSFRMITKRDLS